MEEHLVYGSTYDIVHGGVGAADGESECEAEQLEEEAIQRSEVQKHVTAQAVCAATGKREREARGVREGLRVGCVRLALSPFAKVSIRGDTDRRV